MQIFQDRECNEVEPGAGLPVVFDRVQQYERGCHWRNEATAAGLLNGPVSVEVQNTSDMVGSCTFRLMNEPDVYGLRIVVDEAGKMNKRDHDVGSALRVCGSFAGNR